MHPTVEDNRQLVLGGLVTTRERDVLTHAGLDHLISELYRLRGLLAVAADADRATRERLRGRRPMRERHGVFAAQVWAVRVEQIEQLTVSGDVGWP